MARSSARRPPCTWHGPSDRACMHATQGVSLMHACPAGLLSALHCREGDEYGDDEGGGGLGMDLPMDLAAELSALSARELAAELDSRGLPSAGDSKDEMVARLAEIMRAEVARCAPHACMHA